MACPHHHTEPVTSNGHTLAHLCTDCDEQLPAWHDCPDCDTTSATTLSGRTTTWLVRPCAQHVSG